MILPPFTSKQTNTQTKTRPPQKNALSCRPPDITLNGMPILFSAQAENLAVILDFSFTLICYILLVQKLADVTIKIYAETSYFFTSAPYLPTIISSLDYHNSPYSIRHIAAGVILNPSVIT